MAKNELNIIIAIILFGLISSFSYLIVNEYAIIPAIFLFSAAIILINLIFKKIAASIMDITFDNELWHVYRYGLHPESHFKKPFPAGIFLPVILSVISLGSWKFPVFLTYEARALKRRAAKRHGFYSYSELTDFSNGLIGAAGIIGNLILAIVLYIVPSPNPEYFAAMSIFYAFFNLIPLSKLDGTQILFGSRLIWSILAIITFILSIFAFFTFF